MRRPAFPPHPVLLPRNLRLGEIATSENRIRKRMRLGEGTPLQRARLLPLPLRERAGVRGFHVSPIDDSGLERLIRLRPDGL